MEIDDMWDDEEDRKVNASNNGFWDESAAYRAERMRRAAVSGGVDNLPPEDRAKAYEDIREN